MLERSGQDCLIELKVVVIRRKAWRVDSFKLYCSFSKEKRRQLAMDGELLKLHLVTAHASTLDCETNC